MLPCTEWAALDRPCASTKDWLLPDDIQASAVTIYLSISITFSFTDEGTLRERTKEKQLLYRTWIKWIFLFLFD